jgi:hypothetical protein
MSEYGTGVTTVPSYGAKRIGRDFSADNGCADSAIEAPAK